MTTPPLTPVQVRLRRTADVAGVGTPELATTGVLLDADGREPVLAT